jgi:hypothetical protein
MPSKSNDAVAEIIVREGCFQSQTKAGLPSDNWRIVEDSEGRKAILYMVRFLSTSKRGQPERIPNEPTALRRLADLNCELPSSKSGPFIALAEETALKITHIRVWDISSRIPSARNKLEVAALGRPDWECMRV